MGGRRSIRARPPWLAFAVLSACSTAPVAARLDGGSLDGASDQGPVEQTAGGPSLDILAGVPERQGIVDGAGLMGLFYGPDAMVNDGAGNLYVTDYGRVRKIALDTATVTTVAGHRASTAADGTGDQAAFIGAHGIAYDGQGTLYVTDIQTIRKVDIATAEVTTLVGTPGVYGTDDGTGAAASFTQLQAAALDGQGNLFVTDLSARNIRQVVLATGQVTTFAGSGDASSVDGVGTAASFQTPYGMTYDAGNLYVFDRGAIRRVDVATGTVTTLVGAATTGGADGVGAAAGLGSYGDVKSDGDGNLYLADPDNGAVRKVELASGTVTTIAGMLGQHVLQLGPLPGGLVTPQAVALSSDGAVYISDDFAVLVAR